MALPFFNWSKTAASNATADSTVNWAEGMAPSAVNDSARAMMASIAGYRDDVSGGLSTAGTATAFTVTTNEVFDTLAHMHAQKITILMHTTNGAAPTLNVDGLGAKAIHSAIGTPVTAGMLIANTPYDVVYSNSTTCFVVFGIPGDLSFGVPVGGLIPYVGSSAPNSNFVLPFGQAISRTTYAALFALTSTTFGVGDGSTTFNVPDLRGRSVFGLDNMGGSAASRITVAGGNFNGTTLGASGGAQNHMLSVAEMPAHDHGGSTGAHAHSLSLILVGATLANITPGGGNTVGSVVSNGLATDTASATISAQGGGTAHSVMPPAMTLPYILRVI